MIDPQELLAITGSREQIRCPSSASATASADRRLRANGTVLFTPAANFYGDASFGTMGFDGDLTSTATATLSDIVRQSAAGRRERPVLTQ